MGEIPINRAVREAGDGGAPLVVAAPESPDAQALRRAARILAGQVRLQNMMVLPVL